MSTILIFCLMVAGQFANWLHWLINLVVVACVCIFHFSDGISWMPRYTYGSFWCKTGIG